MIKVSKLADYGIVLLTCMARQPLENTYTARDLSASSGLPLPMVSKVLKLLAKEDLLDSHRGVKGGYSLSRAPEHITAADIIAALDGPIALTSCIDEPKSGCGISSTCIIRDYWSLINNRIIESLQTVTLGELCAPVENQSGELTASNK